jgi:hypothetical protein
MVFILTPERAGSLVPMTYEKYLGKILRLIFWREKSFSESLVIRIASFFQAFAISLGERLKKQGLLGSSRIWEKR